MTHAKPTSAHSEVPATDSATERIIAGLAKLSLVMRHEAWSASGRRGLTPTQSQILAAVAGSREPLGIKAIARQLALTVATVSEAVTTLQAKGLVDKRADAADGRAIVVALTRQGRREAVRAARWPDALREAAAALPPPEQAALLRGLVGMVRALEHHGAIPTARMCVNCTYFRPNEYPGTPRPHHCAYINGPIGDADLRIDCAEMEPADADVRERLWSVLIEGRRLTESSTPGHRRSPSESRRVMHL